MAHLKRKEYDAYTAQGISTVTTYTDYGWEYKLAVTFNRPITGTEEEVVTFKISQLDDEITNLQNQVTALNAEITSLTNLKTDAQAL